MRARDPEEYLNRVARFHGRTRARHARLAAGRAPSPSITATTSGACAADRGVTDAFEHPGFVPEYIRPLFCEGRGPFRWVALSGEPADICRNRRAGCRLFPRQRTLTRWIALARENGALSGSAGAHLLAGLWRAGASSALEINRLVQTGKLQAPIVIGRDHLDCGSVASPYRETEACATAAMPSPIGPY